MVDSSEQYVVHEEKGEGSVFLKKKKEEREKKSVLCNLVFQDEDLWVASSHTDTDSSGPCTG